MDSEPAKIDLTEVEGKGERRAYTRYRVECTAEVSLLTGAALIPGRIVDLSMNGCRVEVEQRFLASMLSRVEVQFQLRGIAFRIVGVTAGNRNAKSFAVRFFEMPRRSQDELAEVIAEVAAMEAAKAPQRKAAESEGIDRLPVVVTATDEAQSSSKAPHLSAPRNGVLTISSDGPTDKRVHNRHSVATSVTILLVRTGISMAGRILDLSQGGCRLRTEEPFHVGIFVRVETEFRLRGLPFRLAGVSQTILDKNTIGIRFLDMSDRKREHLTELITEIAAAEPEAGG